MAGDEEVAADPVAERVHGLVDVARAVAADVHHGVPPAVAQGVEVTGVAVADQVAGGGEEAGVGPAAVEQGDVGAAAQGVVGDRATDEGGAAEDEDPHGARLGLGAGRNAGADGRRGGSVSGFGR
ncbi:hypothetical protein ACIRST_02695 [Kitasatospora sp. NPDC101447]|uniref:hypothetical protein n=1 Tax=Kitasatospora sp. NPDC101447 TaxID=3364102 RepID=UPI0038017EA0